MYQGGSSPVLPVFSKKKIRLWEKEIRALTRLLGDARDLDVQILAVREFLEKRVDGTTSLPTIFSDPWAQPSAAYTCSTDLVLVPEPKITSNLRLLSKIVLWLRGYDRVRTDDLSCQVPTPLLAPSDLIHTTELTRPGLECLLLRLEQHRRSIQPEIAGIAAGCIDSGMIRDMNELLGHIRVMAELDGIDMHTPYAYDQAFLKIMLRVSELLWYEPYLSDSSRTAQHHQMRIAAKRLRYTLEAYSDLFDPGLKEEIKGVKKVQELLGEIHDGDVWVVFLDKFLTDEEERSVSYSGNRILFEMICPGIALFRSDRIADRGNNFQVLCDVWNKMKENGFWDDLSVKISTIRHSGFRRATTPDTEHNPQPISIALISDIHANLPALEAVLADAEQQGALVILNAGDSIGYGPFPDEVISLGRSWSVLSVLGNYDLSVLEKRWRHKKPKSRQKQVAMRWAYHNVSPDNHAWLKALPREIRIKMGGYSLLLTHGSPDSLTEYLDENTPESRLIEIAASSGVDIVVTGHSHRPSHRVCEGVTFVNAGSVGRPEDGDPRACYALLKTNPLSVRHIRVEYDVEKTAGEIRHRHLPDAFARIIREGRPLDVVDDSHPEG
ncbi:MAG TPA: metallophosphoesterase family protein [Methanospirillum sp.]|nr:metallophosphoesterase family protein [Methanospirillum sp.]